MKYLIFVIVLFISFFLLFSPSQVFAKSNSFVTIVNPIRGGDFWDVKGQDPQDVVLGQLGIMQKFNTHATWLIRFDAFNIKEIIDPLKHLSDEKGLFLEITPTLTKASGISYREFGNWHSAGSAFLTGYEVQERQKLIDTSFSKFKDTFGYFPTSVGAWWIDSNSLSYMLEKYNISSALIVSDQYSTDNYQIWGQYFSTPYYPSKKNALQPAQSIESKLPLVIIQWAPRDPLNGYGSGVIESTYSLQVNDYIDYHNLDVNYFSKLIDLYSNQQFNKLSQLVVGLENSYSWTKYSKEYERQIEFLVDKQKEDQLSLVSMKDFSLWYKSNFPNLSPGQIIVADDPLGTYKKVVWFMNPYYRAGWFLNQDGSLFRDIHQYIEGSEELCFNKRCDSVNFATSATRVLDEVSFGYKWIIDEGKLTDFKVSKNNNNYLLSYKNEAGTGRKIEFLPRDIAIDGKISSIDEAILNATKQNNNVKKISPILEKGSFDWSFISAVFKTIKFILFLLIACFIPGYLFIRKIYQGKASLQILFLSIVLGLVEITFISYFAGIFKVKPVIYLFVVIDLLIFIKYYFNNLKNIILIKSTNRMNLLTGLLILTGTILQVYPTIRNGLLYPFGLGFWGPNTHDGIWHISLINQLVKSVPPENPIFSQTVLKNYHFFYDLMIATTAFLTNIPVIDLLFRFYPILLSLSLGIGTYFLIKDYLEDKLGRDKSQIATFFSLFLVYFAGSFGWIVSFIKEKSFAGESAFWANQSISFNLNPPFATSLIIIIALLQLLLVFRDKRMGLLVATILTASLVGFKSYGAVLVLLSLLFVGVVKLKKEYLLTFAGGLFFTILIFLSNFQINSQLILFSPFWLIHSMIDSPDRVGWIRLTLAREAGFEKGIWWKYFTVEAISLLLFIIGNLGLRIFALFLIFKPKYFIKNNHFLFIFIFTLASIVIPILFIQSGNPWNTIQFIYYGLYTTSIIGGVIFYLIISKLPIFLIILSSLAFFIITPINSFTTATYYSNYQPHALVNKIELEALSFLSKQDDGVVLTYPYDSRLKEKIAEPWSLFVYDSTSYVSAFSGKGVYLEDEGQNQILLTDYKKRLISSKDFFSQAIPSLSTEENIKKDKKFLSDNRIKYIYLLNEFSPAIDIDKLGLDKIYDNEKISIYKVN